MHRPVVVFATSADRHGTELFVWTVRRASSHNRLREVICALRNDDHCRAAECLGCSPTMSLCHLGANHEAGWSPRGSDIKVDPRLKPLAVARRDACQMRL